MPKCSFFHITDFLNEFYEEAKKEINAIFTQLYGVTTKKFRMDLRTMHGEIKLFPNK